MHFNILNINHLKENNPLYLNLSGKELFQFEFPLLPYKICFLNLRHESL